MSRKKAVAAGAALAAAGLIGAGTAQAAPLDAFILGGPRTITADVIGAGGYYDCALFAHNTRTTGPDTLVDWEITNGRNHLRLSATQTPGVKYVDVVCAPDNVISPADWKILKRNFPVLVF